MADVGGGGVLGQIQQAQTHKEDGNRYFAAGDYKKALGAYHKVFCYLNGLQAPNDNSGSAPPVTPSPNSLVIPKGSWGDVKQLKQSTHLNMAACYLKVEQYQKCVDVCGKALQQGDNPKAFFRRAQAFLELRNFSGATSDLEKARALAPSDRAIVVEMHKVRAAMSTGDSNEKRTAAKMFARPKESEEDKRDCAEKENEEDVDEIMNTTETENVEESASGETQPTENQTVKEIAPKQVISGCVVDPVDTDVKDEASKPDIALRELAYAWQQSEEEVKVYISFDQSDELTNVDPSRVQVEYGEWSVLLMIKSTVEGQTPWGLRLGDFHRRVDPSRCQCIVRSTRITLKLVKREKEHWWNFLQNVPLHTS
eukprot:TRINITY_DN25607_c0_g1_i1.p1 TRINITY_DN25607_c0_g1~~TRINITY_DN25607_c0_g1_i1.p1  ORF type:complete len:368 (+),score=81.66 TRINITY_DN25607_c0_g1_i1:144-1247(+)